jgi:hypothetical protein
MSNPPNLFGSGRVTCPTCGGSGTVIDVPVASAPARPTDPDTSHTAQERNRSGDVARFSTRSRQARLLTMFGSYDDLTDYEAACLVLGDTEYHTRLEGCRRRCSDLRVAGFLTDSGKRRTNPGSPDEAIVWVITPGGREALYNLQRTGWSKP